MESSSISNTSYEPSKELEPMLNMSQQGELLFETFDLRSVCKVEGFAGSGRYHIMRAFNPATKKHHRLFILEGALEEDEANREVWRKCRKAKYQEVDECEAKMKIIEIEFNVDPTSAARQHFAGYAMNQEDLETMVGQNIDLFLANDLDFESTVKSNTKEQFINKVEVLENEKKLDKKDELCLQIEENESNHKKQSGLTDQVLSDNMDDACKTSCKICDKEITLSHMRHHTKDEHKVKVTEYKRMYGDFKKEASMLIIKKVHHKCHICGKILLLDYDHLAKHTTLKHNMPVKDYKSQFLTCTPEEDKSRKQKREAVDDEDDHYSDIGLKKCKSNLMKKNYVENKMLRRSKRLAFKCNISERENVNMVKTIQAGNDKNSINVNWNRTSDMTIDYQNGGPNITSGLCDNDEESLENGIEENDTGAVEIKSRDDNGLYMPRQTVVNENTRQSVIMKRHVNYIDTPASHVVIEGRGGQEAMEPLARKEERGPLGGVEMAPKPLVEVVGPLAGAGGFNPNRVSQSVGNHGPGGSHWNGVGQSVGNDAPADVKMKIKINQVTNVEIELTPAQLNEVAHHLPGLQGAVVNVHSQPGLQATVGNAHSQHGLQATVGNAHSQPWLQATVGNAHSQPGLQATVGNAHSQPWLQATVGNAHSQLLQATVGNAHSQPGLQASVGNDHSQHGLQAAVGNAHSQHGLQGAVGNAQSQPGLQAAVGNTHSQ